MQAHPLHAPCGSANNNSITRCWRPDGAEETPERSDVPVDCNHACSGNQFNVGEPRQAETPLSIPLPHYNLNNPHLKVPMVTKGNLRRSGDVALVAALSSL